MKTHTIQQGDTHLQCLSNRKAEVAAVPPDHGDIKTMEQEHDYETEQPTEAHGARARPVVTERETAEPTLYEEFHTFALAGDPTFKGKQEDEAHKEFLDRLIVATQKAPDADWDAMSLRAQEAFNTLVEGFWAKRAKKYPAIEGLDSDPNTEYRPQRARVQATRTSISREDKERQRALRLAQKEAKRAEKEQRRREKMLASGIRTDPRPESTHTKLFKLILGNPGIDRTSMERMMEEQGLKATKHTVTSSRGSAFCARKVAKELGLWNEEKEAELSQKFEEEIRRFTVADTQRTIREANELARQQEDAQAAA